MKKLSCKEARQIDLVEYLATLGHQPNKIRNEDYWYTSPFRDENTPSFKVNCKRNIWFDFGEGAGGNIIDFGIKYFGCSVGKLLEQLPQRLLTPSFSFHPPSIAGEKKVTGGSKIHILGERPLTDPSLLQYLQKRYIPLKIAERFCREIDFELYGKKYVGIGFKNDEGGFELRNSYFKGSSSPKASSFIGNGSSQVCVFEGFFDFLTYQVIHSSDKSPTANFLVLNSLSFFQKEKELLEKHDQIRLYLDHDPAGLKYTEELVRSNTKYVDETIFYKNSKDLNEWFLKTRPQSQLLRPNQESIIKQIKQRHHGGF